MEASSSPIDVQLDSVALLQDPVRRAVYFYVAAAQVSVSRDQVAAAGGISRSLAAFHLDRLHDGGLLAVSFERLTGRSGPGAGRPSKLYRRSDAQVAVSLPPREYLLLAELLAQAMSGSSRSAPRTALDHAARRNGLEMGRAACAAAGRFPSEKSLVAALLQVLSANGFEPFMDDGVIRLHNCPFHDVARANTDLVCGMNLTMMDGVVEGLKPGLLTPALEPSEGRCCVAFHFNEGSSAPAPQGG